MTKLALRLGCAALPLLSAVFSSADARACGGCFHPENQPPGQGSVVLAHRMALSISPDASVLWDQVQYTGSPGDFAWVLPVRPGARLEVASDAWFEALDAATTVRVTPPTIQCVTTTTEQVPVDGSYHEYYGCSAGAMAVGCGASAEALMSTETQEVTQVTDLPPPPPDPVTIVHQGSAGPYETVTLHSDVPGALPDWLTSHGYAIDADIQPIIDAYAAEGFDFIALRLLPAAGVQQMKPVRVVQPGAVTTLPLRMVAAGTGPTVALTLFVIGEGKYEPQNFPTLANPSSVSWDFGYQQSDWAVQQQYAFAGTPTGWMTPFSVPRALFSARTDAAGAAIQYQTGLGPSETLADAFFDQALANGEAIISCAGIFDTLAQSYARVVDTCPPEGGECPDAAPDGLDARYFECGPIRDLARALVGLHPASVWVTRLDAQLPRAALADDLVLHASPSQEEISNVVLAQTYTNPPCPTNGAYVQTATARGTSRRAGSVPPLLAAAALALALAVARRRGKAGPAAPAMRG
jgi:hypothetical protein